MKTTIREITPAFGTLNRKLRKTLKKIVRDRVHDANRPDPLAQRLERSLHIAKVAQGGKVLIVSSGVDCDHSSWAGRTELVDATSVAVDAWIDRFYECAEGPQSFFITSPDQAPEFEEESRDLALEAHENGHSHVVYV